LYAIEFFQHLKRFIIWKIKYAFIPLQTITDWFCIRIEFFDI